MAVPCNRWALALPVRAQRMVGRLVAGVGMGAPPIKGTPARGSPVTRCKARAFTVFPPPKPVVY